MIPLRICLKNFMSYRGQQTFLFDGSALWVLTGPNGSGKSAVFDAITFALYGRHRGGGQHPADLINHNENSLAVELDFLVDGEAYRVRRTVPKKGRSTCEAFRLMPTDGTKPAHTDPIAGTEKKEGFELWREQTIGLSYEAFTSCVLLLQGQSDKLLQVEPRDRYKILAQLIDLAPYQQLHELADGHRRRFDSQAKVLGQQLQGIPKVTENEWTGAHSKHERAEVEWRDSQAAVSRLTTFLEQARLWARLKQEHEEQTAKLRESRAMLERTDEIKTGESRYEAIEQSLPALRRIVTQREQLVQLAEKAEILLREISQVENTVAAGKSEGDAAKSRINQLEERSGALQGDLSAVQERLITVALLVHLVEQFESTQAESKQLSEEVAALPADLPELIRSAEERDHQLAGIESSLSWLNAFAQSRSGLANAVEREEQTRASLVAIEGQIKKLGTERSHQSDGLNSARENERMISHEVTRASTKNDEARRRRQRFEDTSASPTCELCGQLITAEHAQRERERLDGLVMASQDELTQLRDEHQKIEAQLHQLESDLSVVSQQLETLIAGQHRCQSGNEQAAEAASQYAAQVKSAFQSLPTDFRALIVLRAPADDRGWLDTVYPTSKDLNELQAEASTRDDHERHLKDLSAQFEQWQRVDALRQAANERLARLEADARLSEAREARDEQSRLERRRTELQTSLSEVQEERKSAATTAEAAAKNVESLQAELQQKQTDIERSNATQSEIERSLQSAIESLPETIRERAASFDEQQLTELEAERARLLIYKELSLVLERARQSVTDYEATLESLDTQISQLPNEAQRPVPEVEAELDCAAIRQNQAEVELREAAKRTIELEQQRRQRDALEDSYLDTQRKCNLYSVLTKLLGPEFLQLDLLRRSERTIVELANEILDGLSRGRMQLELRGADQEEGGSKKALDLVAYNRDTSSQATAVSLVSGSQRFRIAVSLALAIGQHAGQGARRIESVIIDEGFGSLDKNGRDDMVQELNDLKERLDRIILVSHQEEFAGAFTNGYSVGLVDGASQVSPLEHA